MPLYGPDPQLQKEARSARRNWSAFRIAMWGVAGLGAVLSVIGLFWPGALSLLGASAIWIAWNAWARREQARFDALGEQSRAE